MKLAREILRKYWGYDAFRPAQIPILESIIRGDNTIGILTTGGGKSICFQVPALMREGTCIVVCPLIALMKDQVTQLRQRKIPAAAYYSAQSKEDQNKILDYFLEGRLKFLYVSPERLNTRDFQTRVRQVKINLLVIDEAHCISQWGYDFRPAYLHIPNIYAIIPNAPVIALTATATPIVLKDIEEKLELKAPKIFINSYFKPNISYRVQSSLDKVKDLVHWIQRLSGSGLVYVRRRNAAEELVRQLQNQFQIQADYYHAGLSTELRKEKQEKWLKNPQSILVTTNAFGMGIDNPHVSYVIHYHFPESIEAYFQECGRAGRAGQHSYAISLITDADIKEKEAILHEYPEPEEVKNTLLLLFNYFHLPYETGKNLQFIWSIDDFISSYKLDYRKTQKCIQILEENELIYIQDAFYKPEELQIIASDIVIQSLSEDHPDLGQLIQQLIRSYEGIHFKKRVNLLKLAKTYHYNLAELKASLKNLAQREIILYTPSTNQPKIEFLINKLAVQDVPLDLHNYRKRKQVLIDQTKACIQYISNASVCRSQQLLTYLGELESLPCQICDVCLAQKNKLTPEDYIDIKKRILEVLKNDSYTPISEILKLVKKYPSTAIRKVLDRLLELNIVQKDAVESFKKTN